MTIKSKRILVVDDEPGLTSMLKLSLEQRGEYEVREVNVASQARDAARLFRPNLILMDVMMPELDGGTLAAQLQEDPEFKGVPIIFLTAAVKKSEVLSRNGIIGGLPFLAKPVEFKELDDCLRKHLS
jgi:two-component system, OmpR family, response regulator